MVGYFPAAGRRDRITGAPGYLPTLGSFWSSSRRLASDAARASFLDIQASSAESTQGAYHGNGYSIRCVQKFDTFLTLFGLTK